MGKMKRLFLAVTGIALVMALSVCPIGMLSASAESELEPYTFTYYSNYDWADASRVWGSDLVSQIIQEKFNVTIKMAKPDIDPAQKMGIMIATDDLPEVMMTGRDSVYEQLVDLGMLLPLDDYIANDSQYARLVDEQTINASRINGKAYALLNWATAADNPTGNNGWVLNKNIWEQLGSPAITTTDELFDYLMAVKAAEITVDGKSVIPLQFSSSSYTVSFILNSFGINSMAGIVPMDGDLKLYLNDPRTLEGYKYLNKLWNNELLSKECFIEKPEQITEKLATGRVAVYAGIDVTAGFNDTRLIMKEGDPTNDYIVIEPPAAPGMQQSEVYNSAFSTLGWNVVVITKNAKNPERIFQVLDYIHSDEGSLLVMYGPKGELYDELDEQGYPILKGKMAEISSEEKARIGYDKWILLGNTAFSDKSMFAIDSRLPEDEKDWVIQAQMLLLKHSMNIDAFMGMSTNPQEPEGIAATAYGQINEKYAPKIVMAASEDECLAAIQEAINEIYGQGFEKTEAFLTKIYHENLKKLGE